MKKCGLYTFDVIIESRFVNAVDLCIFGSGLFATKLDGNFNTDCDNYNRAEL